MSILDIKELSFSYDGKTKILDTISFEIEKGNIYAILGKNGCGKSTLLDCILGINEYKKGSILLKDRNIKDYTNKELSKIIAYISQNTIINIDYSVRDFLLFGRTPYLKFADKYSKKDYEIVEECAKRCKISHLLNKDINKISGGERQLAFICRALVQEAELFIFDEPTASLDFGNQYKLYDIMKELSLNGMTIIFTTHNPNQVLELDEYVIVLNDSKLYSFGKAKDIINVELLKKVYDMDFEISNNVIKRKF